MRLSLQELILLKCSPFPTDTGYRPASKAEVIRGAASLLEDETFDERTALKLFDHLEHSKLIERVSGGHIRRTFEGTAELRANQQFVQNLVTKLLT